MHTINKDTEITKDVILEAIKYNETLRSRYNKLENYYLGEHDIINRDKVVGLSNNKVIINHAEYITDTNIGYLLGNPVDYQVATQRDNEGKEIPLFDLQPLLDVYKEQIITDLDVELAEDISIFGIAHEYVYIDEETNIESALLDSRSTVIVYDDTIKHKKLFGLHYRKMKKQKSNKDYQLTYADKHVIREYELSGGNLKMLEERPHSFNEVPFIEYKNNRRKRGDYESIITLIDAYNMLQSDRINDKEQLVDAILLLIGFEFSEEQIDLLKEHRVINGLEKDMDAKYLIKNLVEADTDVLRQVIEMAIHKISKTPNMSDVNFIGNSSGVAIRYKLLAFEQNIVKKERYMERGLMERFKLYNNFLVSISKMELIATKEVDAVFKRNLPLNDYETSQMICNLDGKVTDETLVSQLSFIKDASEEVELAKEAKLASMPAPLYNYGFDDENVDNEDNDNDQVS